MDRKILGYFLVFISIALAISVSLFTAELLVLNAGVSLENPDLPEKDREFLARFLYMQNPSHLEDHPELLGDIREGLARELSCKVSKEQKYVNENEAMDAVIKQEKVRLGTDDKINPLFIIFVLVLGIFGMHFLTSMIINPEWREAVLPVPEPGFGVPFGLLSVILFMSIQALIVIGRFSHPNFLIPSIPVLIIFIAVIASILRNKGVNLWLEIGLSRTGIGKAIKTGFIAYLAFFPLNLILTSQGVIICYMFRVVPQAHPVIEELIGSSSGMLIMALVILAIIEAPVFEEIFFRGMLFRPLEYRIGSVMACIVSGILFGIVHGGLLISFVTGFLGIYLAFLMHKTRTVIVPIVVHFLYNSFSMFSILLLK